MLFPSSSVNAVLPAKDGSPMSITIILFAYDFFSDVNDELFFSLMIADSCVNGYTPKPPHKTRLSHLLFPFFWPNQRL